DVLAGRDVAGRAPTGSGKTLAFGLPALARLGRGRSRRPRGLVLSPTRELADQILAELQPFARAIGRSMLAVYGGVSYGPQRSSLQQGIDLLVACPGRLEDLIAQGVVSLGEVDLVIVDEADRMADMGFLPAVRRVLDLTAPDRQTILFSATLDGDVATLTHRYQRDPVRHESELQDEDAGSAEHHFWKVDRADRTAHVAKVVTSASPSIVFTRTRHGADRLAKQLAGAGVSAVALHGGRSQQQRNRALKDFSSGRSQALVATDVAARGIHVDGVASVIHFDPPEDEKAYVHRSGRTARAGAGGMVVSLVDGSQVKSAERLQRSLGIVSPMVTGPAAGGISERVSVTTSRRPERQGHSGDSESIYVGNLPFSVTGKDLEQIFARHGSVRSATVVTHRDSRKSRGFGFVEMTPKASNGAIAALDGTSIAGRRLKVRAARPGVAHP
ncbi:MAG TPA: DEAD/DEAH box helicase, partial [Acidimicrobiia bacterium]|nr:DEAD/DEAH box helicase [Acidimicrobiia bacterium]